MDPKTSRELSLRWLLAGGVFLTLIFFFSPSWGAFRLWSRVPELGAMLEVRRGASVLGQMASPGAEITDRLHRAIQWRLLFPVIGRVLHLPPPLLFGLAHAGALVALGFLITRFRRHGLAWRESALAAVTLGAASWFFTATGWLGYYDSWLALALLVVAFARDRRWMWAACVWAPWVDERFIIAAPLALLCRQLQTGAAAARPDWRRDIGVPAGLVAAFLAVRFGVLAGRSGEGATLGGYLSARDYLDAPLHRIALGVWEGLRAGWFFAGAALWLLRPRRGPALLLAGAVLVTAGVGLATAQDYGRSMTMVLPAAVLGVLLAAPAAWFRPALRTTALLALLLPAHHVMNDHVNPIFYLYHELQNLTSPPPGLRSERFELRGIHAMQRGELAQAEADLTIAIRVSDNPFSPAQQRGVLYATQGRWSEALADFNLMVEHEPKNPDAWCLLAQANFALGDAPAARANIDHALAIAPEGWSARPDVTRFLAKLNRPP